MKSTLYCALHVVLYYNKDAPSAYKAYFQSNRLADIYMIHSLLLLNYRN